jgi:hypothetical protein
MKTQVMKKAWEIAREAVAKFGGLVAEYFSEALREAWKLAKLVVPAMAGAMMVEMNQGSSKLAELIARIEHLNQRSVTQWDWKVYVYNDGTRAIFLEREKIEISESECTDLQNTLFRNQAKKNSKDTEQFNRAMSYWDNFSQEQRDMYTFTAPARLDMHAARNRF